MKSPMTLNVTFFRFDQPRGRWILPGGSPSCHTSFTTTNVPCWFHRLTNRLILGWKWEALQ